MNVFDGGVGGSTTPTPACMPTGFQGTARRSGEWEPRPILEARNVVQWWVYYPAVLHLDDLARRKRREILGSADSLSAYRSGDLALGAPEIPRPAQGDACE